ncbi:hypothetical protein ABIB75_001074 [Bradyrhizobium sp. GM2.2]
MNGRPRALLDLGLVASDQGAPLVQPVALQPHSFLRGQCLEPLDVSG